jgi:3-dehydroquinate dehydratase
MIKIGYTKLNTKNPKICAPLTPESIYSAIGQSHIIKEHAFDFVEFKADSFNGGANLSQLWNALMTISLQFQEKPIIFSCRFSNLDSYFQTDRDYRDIITFAIRSGIPDAVEIDMDRDEQHITDAIDLALDTEVTPILFISAAADATRQEIADQLENAYNEDVEIYHVYQPVEKETDISELIRIVDTFTALHDGTTVICEPVGAIARKALSSGNAFHSPIVYASCQEQDSSTYVNADTLASILQK